MTTENLISTADWALLTELTLNRPVNEVWPVFKDFYSWYTEYTIELVSGPTYQSGAGLVEEQVLKVTPTKDFTDAYSEEASGPRYYIQKTIKIVPEKDIVAMLSGSAYDFAQYTSFYSWKMIPAAKQTTILVGNYGQATLFKPLSSGGLSGYLEKFSRNWHRSWSEAFVSLQKAMDAIK